MLGRFFFHRIQPRGIISLLSIMIMAAVTATSVGAAAIILNELRQTEGLDQSFAAVYAAESGLEDGLYLVKERRGTEQLGATLLSPWLTVNNYPNEGTTNPRIPLPFGATWSRNASVEQQFIVSKLFPDTTTHLDLIDPDAQTGASGVGSMKINWSVNCDQLVHLEVTLLTWDIGTSGDIVFDPANQQVWKETYTCNQTAGLTCESISINSIDGHSLVGTKPYRFSFRSIIPEAFNNECAVENLVATAYSAQNLGGSIVDLPTNIQIKSTGGFSRSQQALTATVPWKAPILGLFGFVVFSDVGITK